MLVAQERPWALINQTCSVFIVQDSKTNTNTTEAAEESMRVIPAICTEGSQAQKGPKKHQQNLKRLASYSPFGLWQNFLFLTTKCYKWYWGEDLPSQQGAGSYKIFQRTSLPDQLLFPWFKLKLLYIIKIHQ